MASPSIDTDYQIATFASGTAGLATLASLGIPNPHPVWKPAVSVGKAGDNSGRLLGAPWVTWQWGFISQAVRDILRTYCVGATAQVYIWTPTTENVSTVPNARQRYLAQLWWPAPMKEENPDAGRRLQFELVFKQLVVV
jgi:hypothetical protein